MPLHSNPLFETAQSLRDGLFDPKKYINEVCDRIDQEDGKVQAFLPEPDRRNRLLKEAEALLREYPNPKKRPPLFCVPIGVKDIFHVDGFPTRAGSQLPEELFEGDEATCISKLRDAGALVAGKTVTTEFALVEPGPTRNPNNLNHTPGGSSSGSAAAVAAGFCPAAIGSQTIGSVVRPASYCGVVGFKPTYGRVSVDGVIPLAPSMDHVGWFAQDVTGVNLIASLLLASWLPQQPDKKPTLGIPDEAYVAELEPEGKRVFFAQIERLKKAGYTVRQTRALSNIREVSEDSKRLLCAEMAQVHRDWFASHEALYRPGTAKSIREGQAVTPEELKKLRKGAVKLMEELEQEMTTHNIDLWVSPAATGPAPEGLSSTGNRIMSSAWNYVGFPTITLPGGKAQNGLPVGFQLIGPTMSDELLLAWAEELRGSLA